VDSAPRNAVVRGTTISPGVAYGFVTRDRALQPLDASPPEVPPEDVGVCGELASTAEGARFLVRLGIRSLSVLPAAAPVIRTTLGSGARSSR
jgi:hypothetical protein